jgi:UDP-N-acetylglucosamine--N-acetylmuramyl-(pentapeptide) pyrophosphoryl-undecaprenol N-acetylglucosamine transferase
MKHQRLVLTGGGTAGHVIPHLALLPGLRRQGWKILYIGSEGIEKTLMQNAQVPFKSIATGKLRRYFSWRNFSDVLRIMLGTMQALFHLWRFSPQLVFSKGGFVSVPVAVAAWVLRIPVLTHEADYSVGLANKIIMRFARETLYTFPETRKYISGKSQLTGLPIRSDIKDGNKERGKTLCNFAEPLTLPVLLIVGGSLGAQRINDAVRKVLPQLLERYFVIHITGAGKESSSIHPRYASFSFVAEEFKHLLALSDIVVSRAGANAIFELLALAKPMLLIPLSQGSRGDQLLNAGYFAAQGWAKVLEENKLEAASLLAAIEALVVDKEKMQWEQRKGAVGTSAVERVLTIIGAYY